MAVARHARGGRRTPEIGGGKSNTWWTSRCCCCCTFIPRGRGEESTRGRWSDVTSDVWAWHRNQNPKRCSHNPCALPSHRPPRRRMSAVSHADPPGLDFVATSHPGRRETLHISRLVQFMRGFDRGNACQSLDAENCSCFACSSPKEHPDHAQAMVLGGPFAISFSRSSNRRQCIILDRSTQRILKIDQTHQMEIFRFDPDFLGFKYLVCSVRKENEPETNPSRGPFGRRQTASHGVPCVSADHHAT